jgi:tetratricopeptide (TPR) repeat protein
MSTDARRSGRDPVRWRQVAIFALLAGLSFAAFGPAIDGEPLWDDDETITDNAALRDASGLARIWTEPGATFQYYPLTYTVLWLEEKLWGTELPGYRVVQILVHALGAWLLFLLLRRLRVPGALLAAAVWMLHPLQVESVVWAAELKNVLSGALFIGGMLVGIAYLGASASETERERWAKAASDRRFVGFVALLLAAVGAKAVAVTLPVALLVVAWWRYGWPTSRRAALVAATTPMGLALGAVAASLEARFVAANPDFVAPELVERIHLAVTAPWFYLGRALVPVRLSHVHGRFDLEAWTAGSVLAAVGIAVTTLVAITLALRGRRAPLAAWGVFVVTLSPALGAVDVSFMAYAHVAERYAYLPLAAVAAFVVGGVAARVRQRAGRARIAAVAGAAVLVALGVASHQRATIFESAESVWRDALEKSPDAFMARAQLAATLLRSGDAASAEREARRALEAASRAASAHHILGAALRTQGRFDEARSALETALGISPGYTEARRDLGRVLVDLGRVDEAVATLRWALRDDGRGAEILVDIGNAYLRASRAEDAETAYRRALAADDGLASAHNGLGAALLQRGENEPAARAFERAVELAPDVPDHFVNWAFALERRGRRSDAIDALRSGRARHPDHRVLCLQLAEAYRRSGDAVRARRQAETCSALR